MLRDRSSPCAVFELATGALEVSSGRLDTTKSTGHTSDRGKQMPVESYLLPPIHISPHAFPNLQWPVQHHRAVRTAVENELKGSVYGNPTLSSANRFAI